MTDLFRNSGVYHFTQDYIEFENDTTLQNNKMTTKLIIQDRIIKNNLGVIQKPFKIYKTSRVNIIIDSVINKNKKDHTYNIIFDEYNFLSDQELKYRPSTIASSVSIKPNKIFKEKDLLNTYKYLNELKTFQIPKHRIY